MLIIHIAWVQILGADKGGALVQSDAFKLLDFILDPSKMDRFV